MGDCLCCGSQPICRKTRKRRRYRCVPGWTIDLATTGLIKDLKQRGLLENTIVLRGGEFGRMPVAQSGNGRDHNKRAGTLWLAGGGFKRGCIYGKTDEVGYTAVENSFSVPDLFATILHQLGLDH